MRALSRDEFVDALQKGKGRVVQHLQEFGPGDLRTDILQACLNNLVYDTQCEDARAGWLMSLIDLCGDDAFFREHIVAALSPSTESWNVSQLCSLAELFARRGDTKARAALIEKFEKQEFNESWLGGSQLVALDGIDGLLQVAEVIGCRLRRDQDYWEDDALFTEAAERSTPELVMAALRERAATSENVCA